MLILIPESHIQRTKRFSNRPVNVANESRNLNEKVPAHRETHSRRKVLVDQSSVVIVSLVPDDSVEERRCQEDPNAGESKSKVLRGASKLDLRKVKVIPLNSN
jgi:hypothetical protein